MNRAIRAARRTGIQCGARVPLAPLNSSTSGRILCRPLWRRTCLLSSCGLGFVGVWATSRPGSALLCEGTDVAAANAIVEKEESSTAGIDRRGRSGPRSWRRWLRMLQRCGVLLFGFGPLVIATPLLAIFWRHGGEGIFWKLLLVALDSSGPTFVKLAQWASTRPDMLPAFAIQRLTTLQARTRPHTYEQTAEMFAEAFGSDWAEKIKVDPAPVGSGCMGQVYHGWLLGQNAGTEDKEVAVKVRHPGAKDKVELDLDIMRWGAQSLESLWSRLDVFSASEFVDHFEAFILPQADMKVEATNLDKFNQNFPFASTGRGVRARFPLVEREYLSESVLVMTYERATNLTELLAPPHDKYRTQKVDKLFRAPSRKGPALLHRESSRNSACLSVGRLCLDTYLQMMFRDRFIHGDMHPGNLLVRFPEDGTDPELVVIDAGLSVQMGPQDQRNFVDLMHAVAMKDGVQAGRLMVERSPGDRSAVIDEEVFVTKVGALVNTARAKGFSGLGKDKAGISDTLAQMLQLAYNHRVKLETSFVTVVTSIVVLEGVARQLDPSTDVIEAATPYLVKAVAAHAFGMR